MDGLEQRIRDFTVGDAVSKRQVLAQLLEALAHAVRAEVVEVGPYRFALSPGSAWMELNITVPGGWFFRLEVGKGRA